MCRYRNFSPSDRAEILLRLSRSRWLSRPINAGKYRGNLTDKVSVTQRLKAKYPDFCIEVLSFKRNTIPSKYYYLYQEKQIAIREVLLKGKEKKLMFGMSFLPVKMLKKTWRWKKKLDAGGLGNLLFSHPKIQRCDFMFQKLSVRHPLYQRIAPHTTTQPADGLWVRCSVFIWGRDSIVVQEVFL